MLTLATRLAAPKSLIVLAAVLGTLLSAPVSARPRPTVDNPNGDDCFNDPGTDKGTSSAIAYCCYDDGCFICGVTPLPGDDCVWDGAYRFVKERGLFRLRTFGPLTINPGLMKVPLRGPGGEVLVNPPALVP